MGADLERVVNVEDLDISTLEEWDAKLAPLKVLLPPFVMGWNQWRGFFLKAVGKPFTESEQAQVVRRVMGRFSNISVEADFLPEDGVER